MYPDVNKWQNLTCLPEIKASLKPFWKLWILFMGNPSLFLHHFVNRTARLKTNSHTGLGGGGGGGCWRVRCVGKTGYLVVACRVDWWCLWNKSPIQDSLSEISQDGLSICESLYHSQFFLQRPFLILCIPVSIIYDAHTLLPCLTLCTSSDRYVVKGGVPGFIVLPCDSAFRTQFLGRYQCDERWHPATGWHIVSWHTVRGWCQQARMWLHRFGCMDYRAATVCKLMTIVFPSVAAFTSVWVCERPG